MNGELEQVQKALRDLGKSLKGVPRNPLPEEVHKLRTSARRVEAIATALPEAEGKASRRLVKSIEPLRKAAGGVRDMDVLAANMRKLRQIAPTESLDRLAEHLESVRTDEAGELRQALQHQGKAAKHNLEKYSQRVESAMAESENGSNGHARRRQNHNGMSPTVKHVAREIAEWPALGANNIHDFRLKVKELRYVLQLDAHADHDFVDALGKVQRRIGDWHDWEQLAKIAREFLRPEQDGKLMARIDETANQKLHRALGEANALRRRYLRTSVHHVLGC